MTFHKSFIFVITVHKNLPIALIPFHRSIRILKIKVFFISVFVLILTAKLIQNNGKNRLQKARHPMPTSSEAEPPNAVKDNEPNM